MNPETHLALTAEQAEAVLAAWLGEQARCTAVVPLHGGMINSVLRLEFTLPPHSAVIKLSTGKGFSGEAHALRHLREREFPCPAVYREDASATLIPYTFLLLETLPGDSMAGVYLKARDRARVERELAQVLIDLHAHQRATFGAIDAEGEPQWVDVFMPRLHSVRAEPEVTQRLPREVLGNVDRAIALAPDLLQEQGKPTLVHGDIWAANVMVAPRPASRGNGWHLSGLVDPGAQYADVEYELAYLRVFDTMGATFFEVYTEVNPLRPGYERRWLVYWLRTYLVHVWLFGDQHYRDMTALVAQELVNRI